MNKGQSIIEILVAVTLGAVMILGAIAVIMPALKTNTDTIKAQTGAGLAKEFIDGVRVFAEADWHNLDNLSPGQNYHLRTTSSPYAVFSGAQSVVVSSTTYARAFQIQGVNRDTNGRITVGAGNNDPSTKKVIVVWSWPQTASSSVSIYFTRWRNRGYVQTDWSSGGGQDGPLAVVNSKFAQKTYVDYATTTGSIVIDILTWQREHE